MPFGQHDADGTGLHSYLGPSLYARYYTMINRKIVRDRILSFYGNKCGHCGFFDVRALQIDHVNSDGNKERGTGKKNLAAGNIKYLHKVLKEPERYQLLCANCNWIKRSEKKEFTASKYDWNKILKDFKKKEYLPIEKREKCRRGHDLSKSLIKSGKGEFACGECKRIKNKPLICGYCKKDFMNYKETEFCSNTCSAKARWGKIKSMRRGK